MAIKESSFFVEQVTGMEFMFVKGGSFKMGSDEGFHCESPVHPVQVSDFAIGKYVVTQAQWIRLMNDNPSCFRKAADNPVEQVSWNDVSSFLKVLNQQKQGVYRLPTEAEWEFAAKGRYDIYAYAGSDEIEQVGWIKDNSGAKTHPVGKKKPNSLGLYDMTGNVWEWTNDWYDVDYYDQSPINDPQGAATGTQRVARGGCWDESEEFCRNTYRDVWFTHYKNNRLGFRVVKQL